LVNAPNIFLAPIEFGVSPALSPYFFRL